MMYSYVQVAYTIALSQDTEDREYRPLEQIRDNYPKYVATTDTLLQRRNGIYHINIVEFMKTGGGFLDTTNSCGIVDGIKESFTAEADKWLFFFASAQATKKSLTTCCRCDEQVYIHNGI